MIRGQGQQNKVAKLKQGNPDNDIDTLASRKQNKKTFSTYPDVHLAFW